MRPATIAEVRELARRSRATQRSGLLAIVVALLAAPVAVAFGGWAAYAAVAAGGVAFVWYARRAGQERGAYRALLRGMKAKKKDEAAEAPAAG